MFLSEIATATPVQIDTRIQEIHWAVASIVNLVRREQVILRSEFVSEADKIKAQAEIEKLGLRQQPLEEELYELSSRYNREGWTRYFLVQNSNGHVHTSQSCTTCFYDTSYGWLTQFSGVEQAEMGKLSGMDACAVCFPGLSPEIMAAKRDARVDTPRRIADREALAAKKAQKAKDASDKGITFADGSPVCEYRPFDTKPSTYVVKTERTAQINYVDFASDALVWSDPANVFKASHMSDAEHLAHCARNERAYATTAAYILPALAHKSGVTVGEKYAELAKKVQLKARKMIKEGQEQARRHGLV